MSTPNLPEESSGRPTGQSQPPGYGYPNPTVPPPPSGYPVHPGYPPPGYGYGSDPEAPYGRDPETGKPLSDKSAVAAGCLQLFVGMFGVGRFYIGSVGIGGVQLALTFIGIALSIVLIGFFILAGVAIWAFIDAIMMFTGSVTDSKGRKLR
jgi:TM2 domain-containing membrane protein YozV